MTTAEILAAATARPWQSDNGDTDLWGIFDTSGSAIAYLTDLTCVGDADNLRPHVAPMGNDDRANAAYIVLAVNAYEHDQHIIKALSEALHHAIVRNHAYTTGCDACMNAKTALAKEAQSETLPK